MTLNKANLRDFIAATGLVILLKFDPNHRFFVPCDLEIWWMALENNRAPHLYYIKLCASFQIHRWIQIGITVGKRSIWVKIDNFLSRVTLKFDRWHWKTIEHLLYVASSFVYHFTAISELKLELQSGNAQFGSNSTIFLAVWPWNSMDDLKKQLGTSSMLLQALCIISYPLMNSNLSYSPETLNSGQNRRFCEPCDLEILRITLKNNRASLLCYFNLCVSFRTNWFIQIRVTVRKRPIWVKFDDF